MERGFDFHSPQRAHNRVAETGSETRHVGGQPESKLCALMLMLHMQELPPARKQPESQPNPTQASPTQLSRDSE